MKNEINCLLAAHCGKIFLSEAHRLSISSKKNQNRVIAAQPQQSKFKVPLLLYCFELVITSLATMSVPEPPSPFQLKVKTWTAVATALTIVSLVVFDWDKTTGHPTVFSGIRPALVRQVNRFYGIEEKKVHFRSFST